MAMEVPRLGRQVALKGAISRASHDIHYTKLTAARMTESDYALHGNDQHGG